MAAPENNLPAFPWRRVLPGMVVGVALFFLFLQSLTTALAWQRSEIVPDTLDWVWIGLLPLWISIYLRYFSIFRHECSACAPREGES